MMTFFQYSVTFVFILVFGQVTISTCCDIRANGMAKYVDETCRYKGLEPINIILRLEGCNSVTTAIGEVQWQLYILNTDNNFTVSVEDLYTQSLTDSGVLELLLEDRDVYGVVAIFTLQDDYGWHESVNITGYLAFTCKNIERSLCPNVGYSIENFPVNIFEIKNCSSVVSVYKDVVTSSASDIITRDSPQTAEEIPRITDVAVTIEFPHSTNVVMTTELQQTTEVAMTTEFHHTTENIITTESPHTTEIAMTTESPQITAAVVTTTELLQTTEVAMTTEVPHTTEIIMTTESPQITDAVTTTEAPKTSHDAMTTELSQPINIVMTTESSKSIDTTEIVIVSGPSIAIRCISNCRNQSDPLSSIDLYIDTAGHVTTYSWSVAHCETHDVTTCTRLIQTYPQYTTSNFLYYSRDDPASVAWHHAALVTVTFTDQSVSKGHYLWQYSPVPVAGVCHVTPQTGYSLVTHYNVTCHDFSVADEHQLTYTVYTNTQDSTHKALKMYKGSEPHASQLLLPSGTVDTDYTVYILVKAAISSGASATVTTSVQVKPTNMSPDGTAANVAKDLIIAREGTNTTVIGSLLEAGNQDEAVSLIGVIASTISGDTQTDTEEFRQNKQIIESAMSHLVTVVATTNEQLDNLATSLVAALNFPLTQMSQSSQDTTLSLIDTLSHSLGHLEDDGTSVTDTAETILTALDVCMGLKTDEGEVLYSHEQSDLVVDTKEHEKLEQDKKALSKMIKATNQLAVSLTLGIGVNQPPVVIVTPDLALTVAKVSVDTLGGQTYNNPDSTIDIPALDLGVDDTSEISLQVVYSKRNVYFWDKSADDVNSPLLSMEIVSNKGPLNVTNLIQPLHISLTVPENTESVNTSLIVHLVKQQDNVTLNMSRSNVMTFNFTCIVNKTTTLEISPELNISLKLYINDTAKPTLEDILQYGISFPSEIHLLNKFANFDLISNNTSTENYQNSSKIYFTNNDNSGPSQYYVGVTVDLDNPVTMATLRDLDPGCVGDMTLSECRSQLDIMVNVSTMSLGCVYWDIQKEIWTTAGCQVSPYSSGDTLECLCTHLTSFAGSVLVLPNFVDPIADAALFLTFFDNPVVVTTVILVWMVYFFLIHWARRADKHDQERVGVITCSGNDPSDNYVYLVCLVTGWWKDAGTSANIFFYMKGKDDVSPRRCLSTSVRPCFQTGYEDWFLFTTPKSLGDLDEITIWHDNSGSSPDWYLSQVYIKDIQTGDYWTFIYNDWLSVERGSILQTTATITAVSRDELKQETKHNFMLKSSKDLRDGHLWISIFSKPVRSTFTRVQRLTCALSLLLTTMLTNIMFYGVPTDAPEDQVGGAGGVVISLSAILIGIESSLIMFPVNVIILQLFLKVKPKPDRRLVAAPVTGAAGLNGDEERKKHDAVSATMQHNIDVQPEICVSVDRQVINKVSQTVSPVIDSQMYFDAVSEKDLELCSNTDTFQTTMAGPKSRSDMVVVHQTKTTGKILPWWFVYVTWCLVIATCMVSSYFVMLYGLKYGYTRSVEWLVSFLTGFTQSAFITQPLKVLAIAMVYTLIFKKAVEFEDYGPEVLYDGDDSYVGDVCDRAEVHLPYVEPLSRRLRLQIQERLKIEWLMNVTLRDICLYIVYLSVVLFMVHGHRNVRHAYYNTVAIEDVLVNPDCIKLYQCFFLDKADNVEYFYQYLYEVALPNLADMSIADHNYATPGSNHYLVGTYRLRQLRVDRGTCSRNSQRLYDQFDFALPECTGPYWLGDQDSGHYNHTWTHRLTTPSATPTHWTYQSSWQLKTIPYAGKQATYSGGGYVLNMPSDTSLHAGIIEDMWNSDWIDERTRAVFLEFTLYNPNADLFSVVIILWEFSNSGAVVPQHQIFTTKLYHYSTDFGAMVIFCEVAYLCFNIAFVYIEYTKYKKLGRSQYFGDFWSYIEILQIVVSYTVIGLFFQRIVSVNSILADFNASSGHEYVSFYTAISWDFILQYLMAFLVAIVTLKAIKLLRFNRRVYMISDTLTLSKDGILSFLFMVVVFMMAFGHFTMLVFGKVMYGYRNMLTSFLTIFNFALGVSDLPGVQATNRILGPLYFVTFVFLAQFCFLTVFMVILNYGINNSKDIFQKRKNKFEIVDYVMKKLKSLTTM